MLVDFLSQGDDEEWSETKSAPQPDFPDLEAKIKHAIDRSSIQYRHVQGNFYPRTMPFRVQECHFKSLPRDYFY